MVKHAGCHCGILYCGARRKTNFVHREMHVYIFCVLKYCFSQCCTLETFILHVQYYIQDYYLLLHTVLSVQDYIHYDKFRITFSSIYSGLFITLYSFEAYCILQVIVNSTFPIATPSQGCYSLCHVYFDSILEQKTAAENPN